MNSQMNTPIKVRLKADLTHYHPDLTAGVEGFTIGVYGKCSQLSKHYTGVWFPGIHLLDVNWASLEIIDEKNLAHQTKEDREQREPIRMAWDLVKRTVSWS